MDKYAAIDLGTNTFHLLIASFDSDGKLVEHFRLRRYIHLAQKGIERIADEAFDRALNCLSEFNLHLLKHNVTRLNCSGTAALRTASNGPKLVERIKAITGIEVNIIDGISEAKYIYDGVCLAIPSINSGNHLIMDIGGGSVEFILIKNGEFFWSNSFPVGIAVLKKQFHHNEPILNSEIKDIKSFLASELSELIETCKSIEFDSLIGASGSFEVLSGMVDGYIPNHLKIDIPLDFFYNVYDGLIGMRLQERINRKDIPNNRVHLIVVAFLLIKFALDQFSFDHLTVSAYAMKEGILRELKD